MRTMLLIAGAMLLCCQCLSSAAAKLGQVVLASVQVPVKCLCWAYEYSGWLVNTRAGLNARASARGPSFTPRGWRHGRKVGWHGGSRPPGLR